MSFLPIFLLSLLVIASSVTNSCLQVERHALLDFKAGMINPGNRLASWKGLDCCRWAGIKCSNHTGRVIKLDLANPYYLERINSFSGEISSSLLALIELRYMDLSYNDLMGTTFPKFICSFRNLEYLDLSETGLSGIIPPQISNMSKLQTLSLGDSDYPMSISINNLWCLSHLTFLKHLTMDGVNIHDSREWVQALNMLPSLEYLFLSTNNLTTIPAFLPVVNFSSLTEFNLFYNNFNTLMPNWIGEITSLAFLALEYCSFIGQIPNIFGNLKSLEWLWLDGNYLEGPIPSLHNLHNLTSLSLGNIYINEDIIDLVSKLSNKTLENFDSLTLFNTSLTGNLTSWLYKMTNLFDLDLSQNNLNGTIPTEIGNLTNLSYLFLSRNSFVGDISEIHITNLSQLRILDLSYNSLSGSLSPKFKTPLLYTLLLSNNHISGIMGQYTCGLIGLTILDLSRNNIYGNLPNCWPNTLEVLNLANNKINGTIPNSIRSSDELWALQLNNNSLNGEFPSSLQFCRGLNILDLGENKFYGKIPEWIGKISNLTILRLRANFFTGNIPLQLLYLNKLQVLDLGDNNLSGLIPDYLDKMVAMTLPHWNFKFNSYDIDDTELQFVSISISMKDSTFMYSNTLSFMTSIDLSKNTLTGEIPQSITTLFGLRNLNLSYNYLNGKIPVEIGNLQSLESLDFRSNELSGIIPPSLGSVTFLTTLNLSYNNLSGEIPKGNQLQTFLDPYIYMGNSYLCGSPLNKRCNTAQTLLDNFVQNDNNKLDEILLYLFTIIGLGFGFWFFFGVLVLKKTWRFHFFDIVDNIYDIIYVFVMLNLTRFGKYITE